jgi:hypothetical protein
MKKRLINVAVFLIREVLDEKIRCMWEGKLNVNILVL